MDKEKREKERMAYLEPSLNNELDLMSYRTGERKNIIPKDLFLKNSEETPKYVINQIIKEIDELSGGRIVAELVHFSRKQLDSSDYWDFVIKPNMEKVNPKLIVDDIERKLTLKIFRLKKHQRRPFCLLNFLTTGKEESIKNGPDVSERIKEIFSSDEFRSVSRSMIDDIEFLLVE